MAFKRRRFPKRGNRTNGFRSEFEARVAEQLTGLPYTYEGRKIEFTQHKAYVPDFTVGDVVIEAKGYFDSADRTKHLLVKQSHPDLDVRFVFQNAHTKLNRNSKLTYALWCDKHGFKWAHKDIPHEWREELTQHASLQSRDGN